MRQFLRHVSIVSDWRQRVAQSDSLTRSSSGTMTMELSDLSKSLWTKA